MSASQNSYERGWKAGANPTPAKVEAADRRGEGSRWYLGFFDREAGRPKYTSLPTREGA